MAMCHETETSLWVIPGVDSERQLSASSYASPFPRVEIASVLAVAFRSLCVLVRRSIGGAKGLDCFAVRHPG